MNGTANQQQETTGFVRSERPRQDRRQLHLVGARESDGDHRACVGRQHPECGAVDVDAVAIDVTARPLVGERQARRGVPRAGRAGE